VSENNTELIIYQTEDGVTQIDVRMENETVWLSLDQMAELFQRDKSTISRHIKNIFVEGELVEKTVIAKYATTALSRKSCQVTVRVYISGSGLSLYIYRKPMGLPKEGKDE
jgi:hypothetical protein